MKQKIAIGLCTYKRPDKLHQCLISLNDIVRPNGVEIIILVADNDENATAKSTIENFQSLSDIPIYYDVENEQGIPFARNNILKQAKELGVTELAFIDDDEYVDIKWLVTLWEYYVSSQSDVVRGLVKTVYPPNTPGWIVKGQFYQRENYITGKVFTWSNTGNVLFNYKKLCIQWGLLFDESFKKTGGSDKDFFRRAHFKGASIVWVSEAIAYEPLEESRYRISYLLKRKFRTRNSQMNFKNLGIKRWIKLFIKSFFEIFKGIFSLPVNIFLGKHRIVKSLVNIILGTARILGLFKVHIKWEEYKK